MNSTASAWIAASAALAAVFVTQFLAENYRRFRDGSALAAGLYGELKSYDGGAEILRARLENWILVVGSNDPSALSLREFERPKDMFFDESVAKLGLLNPDMVRRVVLVYSHLRAFRMGLELLTKEYRAMERDEFALRCELLINVLNRADTEANELVPLLLKRSKKQFLSSSGEGEALPLGERNDSA